MAFCKTCGAELKEGAKFCMNCGASTAEEPVEAVSGEVVDTPESFKEKAEEAINKAEEKAAAFNEKAAETVNKVENKVDDFVYKAEEKVDSSSSVPGKGKAIASLVLGVVGVILSVFGFSTVVLPIIGLILGIVGVVLSAGAKKSGYVGGMRTAGFILSLIALIFGAIMFICCLSCAGAVGCAACAAASALA